MTWIDDFNAAVRDNLDDTRGGRFIGEVQDLSARQLATQIRLAVPYRFLGAEHRIVGLLDVMERGFGACADGAAIAAAVAIKSGRRWAVCYEEVPSLPDYAHARVVLGSRVVEPWPEHRIKVSACSFTLTPADFGL